MADTTHPRRAPGGRDIRGWRQPRCATCGLTERHCLCATLSTLVVRTRVAVVMHYIEALRSTNTGRLAVRMLSGSTLRLRGEREDPVEAPAGRRLLLFPLEGARLLTPEDASDDLILVVPDGTWGQARRIARRDPFAVGAEAVTLPESGGSLYGLRRSERPGGLCTMEAIAAAMGVLEGETVATALRRAFDDWSKRAVAVRAGR